MIYFNNKFRYILLLIAAAVFIGSCTKDQWDEHNRITDSALNENLLQAINANPDLSKFSEYLSATGYDKVIASSKSFTVFAPTNEALANVDASVLADTAQLRLLVENHIADQTHFTSMAKPSLRIKTLNGKYVIFTAAQVNDANITKADEYVNNGVLQVIDKALVPEMNAWEYLNKKYGNSKQQAFLQSLEYMYVDPDSAEQIGVDAQTGLPIYKPGTGLVKRNRFLQKVNINDEDSALTYIILTDDAFSSEVNKLQPYFTDTTQMMTDSVTRWNVVKDLAFKGVYQPDDLPGTLYSANDSVVFHLNKSAIVSSQKVSNGMVYVMNHIDYELNTKIKPVIIQGEKFLDLLDPTVDYTIRKRRNPQTDSIFQDIYIANHGIADFWIRYKTVVNSVKYKVYWVAVNDFQTGTFPMKVAFKAHTDTLPDDRTTVQFDNDLGYKDVELNDYNEVYLGDYTPNLYGNDDVFLVGNNTRSNGANTLVLDYIKLVPVLN